MGTYITVHLMFVLPFINTILHDGIVPLIVHTVVIRGH